jgi:G3E family GTPase
MRTGPIARSFWENEEMGDLTLDGIVCVVDCRNILQVRPIRSGHTARLYVVILTCRQQIAGDRPQGEINECIKSVIPSPISVDQS